ncbi:MAG: PEGA domain-containing protein [Pseudomonadota bacterium]
MATPETHSVELDPFTPSFDGDLNAVQSEENQVVEAETRELSAYSFDSDDQTLVGIGISGSADSSRVRHFDSSDRTLVGIGPAERAKRAKLAELAEFAELVSHSRQAESAPECVRMPHSEPPGPFVASDDDEGVSDRLPMQKREPWVLALSAVLVAAAAVALLRGVVPHTAASRLSSATTVAPPPTANESRARDVQFETAAVTSAETSASELPITQATEAPQPAPAPTTAQRETQPELAPLRVTTKSAGSEPLGALAVTSNPPSGLVLDGRPLGKAPRVIQLPSGPHTVLFVNPERGRMSVTVNVRAGRTTRASANF